MRWTLLWLLLPALTGCALPLPQLMERAPEPLFDQFLQELAAGGPEEALLKLRGDYPQSPWTLRAEAVVGVVASRETAAREGASRRLKTLERDLAASRRETESQRTELARLKRDLEDLKQLVIEMELRGRLPAGKKH
ncbi:MAG: hypothetical protein IH614_02000 [Desulfuromonadales bacterium]|nr:hypothetical protein [Desulfuromonadales bacterium]